MDQTQAKLFIQTWWSSRTIVEFCVRFKTDRRHASDFASFLRKSGVPLKKMPYTRKGYERHKFNMEELAEHSLRCESEAEITRIKERGRVNAEAAKAYELSNS